MVMSRSLERVVQVAEKFYSELCRRREEGEAMGQGVLSVTMHEIRNALKGMSTGKARLFKYRSNQRS